VYNTLKLQRIIKIPRRQSMHCAHCMRNNRAKFHPDPIWNDGALAVWRRVAPTITTEQQAQEQQHEYMGSVLIEKVSQKFHNFIKYRPKFNFFHVHTAHSTVGLHFQHGVHWRFWHHTATVCCYTLYTVSQKLC